MRRFACLVTAVSLAGAVAGCSVSNDDPDNATTKNNRVVIATHSSWAAPQELIDEFEQESGLQVRILPSGDAGELTNKLVLTKGNPIADGVYGIDNTFATRAIDEDVLADYHAGSASSYDLPGDGAEFLTPIDWGDVCVNVDDVWFAEHDLAEPSTLDDLLKPAYKGLFATPGAASSSPGFAFLLATIGKYGEDGWQDYWKRLMANDAKLASDWTEAYEVDFTAGGGRGDRPIVLSYNSSPPFTIAKDTKKPTTSALLDTCFRQVEYAGVLAGGDNPEGAKKFIDFMTQKEFQEALPDNMYVFPVNPDAELPALWARWAKPAPAPIEVDPAAIASNRDAWLTEWSDVTTG